MWWDVKDILSCSTVRSDFNESVPLDCELQKSLPSSALSMRQGALKKISLSIFLLLSERLEPVRVEYT